MALEQFTEFDLGDGTAAKIFFDTKQDYWYFSYRNGGGCGPTRDAALANMFAAIHKNSLAMEGAIERSYIGRINELEKRLEALEAPEIRAAEDALSDAKSAALVRAIGLDSYHTSGRAAEDAAEISRLTANLNSIKQSTAAQVAA